MSLNRPRIAIVEDDADQLHSLEEFLLDAGYPVWGVASAEAFYKRFMGEPADVVLLDIGLPGDDGLSVAALLKARPDVAVIILSARDALGDRLAGMRAGADRYLVKPVNLLELAANIDATASRLHRPAVAAGGSLVGAATGAPRPWTLALKDWALCSPAGRSLTLTTHEFLFVQHLAQAQGRPVSKRELSDKLFGARAQNGSERLNLLVTRLRKKAAEALGEALPVKTLHQIGYTFTVSVRLGEAA